MPDLQPTNDRLPTRRKSNSQKRLRFAIALLPKALRNRISTIALNLKPGDRFSLKQSQNTHSLVPQKSDRIIIFPQ